MSLKLIYTAFNMLIDRGRDASGNVVSVGPTIMVVTPYQAQLTNIFEENSLIRTLKEEGNYSKIH